MNKLLEKIYYCSPIFMQNIAISALGFKLKNERFNEAGDRMLDTLKKTSLFSRTQMKDYQDAAFVQLARHAITTTSYYQQWAQRNRVSISDINSLEDLKRFPIIEKSFLRDNHELFISRKLEHNGKCFKLYTSGTTGTPLTVYTDKYSRSKHYAFFTRLRDWYGVKPDDKRATLFGRIIMPASEKKPPFWRYDASQKNLLMSSYHLKEENLAYYYQKIREYQPEEIFSYPSSIIALAEYILSNGLEPISLKLVMTTAEHLFQHQRTVIGKAFNARIVNQYGCTEMAFFASDLPDGGMHLHPEHGIAEIRTENGYLHFEGSGELVTTGLINYAMPVIRYAVGDAVTLGPSNDHGFTSLLSVQGRTDDLVYMSDGTPVGRLDPIFKGGSGINATQIVQSEKGDITLRLVPSSSYSSQNGIELIAELKKRVGDDLPISIELCEEIEKSKNGKFKPVISNYLKSR